MRPPLVFAVLLVVSVIAPVGGGVAASTADGPTELTDSPPNATVTNLSRARGGLYEELTSAAALARARDSGRVDPADPVVVGEVLVVRLESRELAAHLDDRPEPTTTARFFGLMNGTDANLSLVQTNPTTMRNPNAFALSPESTRVVATNDTVSILIDTTAVRLRYFGGSGADQPVLRPGERYAARFHVGSLDQYAEFEDAPTAAFVDPEATLARNDLGRGTDDERVRLASTGDDLAVRATTASGTTVRVRLVGARTGVVLVNRTARVTTDGRASVPVAADAVAAGTNVTVELRPVGYEVSPDTVPARVVDPSASIGPATLGKTGGASVGYVFRLRDTRLALGGFLVLGAPSETVLAVEPHRAGTTIANLVISDERRPPSGTALTVTAYRDSDHDGAFEPTDEPYRANGTAVRASVTFDPDETPTATATSTLTSSESATPTPPTAGQPGFGLVPALGALAALCALAAARGR
jgi:hypothetical protein